MGRVSWNLFWTAIPNTADDKKNYNLLLRLDWSWVDDTVVMNGRWLLHKLFGKFSVATASLRSIMAGSSLFTCTLGERGIELASVRSAVAVTFTSAAPNCCEGGFPSNPLRLLSHRAGEYQTIKTLSVVFYFPYSIRCGECVVNSSKSLHKRSNRMFTCFSWFFDIF